MIGWYFPNLYSAIVSQSQVYGRSILQKIETARYVYIPFILYIETKMMMPFL